jgi:hypothetical protein
MQEIYGHIAGTNHISKLYNIITLLQLQIIEHVILFPPIPVAMRSKAWVCGRLFTGIVSSNPVWFEVLHGEIVRCGCRYVEYTSEWWQGVRRVHKHPTVCS